MQYGRVSFRAFVMFCLIFVAIAPREAKSQELSTNDFALNTSTSAPYNTDDHQGFLDLVIAEAFKRAGLQASVVQYNASKRALINANNGVDHGVAMRIKNLEKNFPNLRRIPESIVDNDFVAYSKNSQLVTDSWGSLSPYRVAYLHGWVIFEKNLDKDQKSTSVKHHKQMFEMLEKNRVDFVLYEKWMGLQEARDHGMSVIPHEPPLASVPMYMYIHKDYAQVIPAIDKALKSMKADGTYQAIFDQTLMVLMP